MSLRAVDLQVILPRAQEVSRIQHVQQAGEQGQQQALAAAFQQAAEAARATVQQLPEPREARIKERVGRERGASGQGSRGGREEGKSFQAPREEVRGSILDLKV